MEEVAAGASALKKLESDVLYCQYLKEEFDSARALDAELDRAKDGAALSSARIDAARSKLLAHIASIDITIKQQVSSQHTELLTQVHLIDELEQSFGSIYGRVGELKRTIQAIKQQISEPYAAAQRNVQELRRAQEASELLRKLMRFLSVASKLKEHLRQAASSSVQLPKAAQCLHELSTLRRGQELAGIELVENEVGWIERAHEQVLSDASRLLLQGMESQNQSEVASALQVFYNLQILSEKVRTTLEMIENKAKSAISGVLNFSEMCGSVGNVNASDTGTDGVLDTSRATKAAITSTLLVRLEKLCSDNLHQACVHMHHLQRVLSKMRDPHTHVCLIHLIELPEGEVSITKMLWKRLTGALQDQLVTAAESYPILQSTFTREYPRLASILLEFLARLHTHFELKPRISGDDSHSLNEEEELLMASVGSFEAAYLQQAQKRVLTPLNAMFPSASREAPAEESVSRFMGACAGEFERANRAGKRLYISVAGTVARAVHMFVKKCDSLISRDAEAYTLADRAPARGQVQNVKLFNALHTMHTQMSFQCQHLPSSVKEAMAACVGELEATSESILHPLFARIAEAFERTLLTLHGGEYGADGASVQTSKCIELVQFQLSLLQRPPFSEFSFCPALSERYKVLVTRIVEFFVRQAALLRPLSDAGKLTLASDMAQLELSLNSLSQLQSVGRAYGALRALRPVVFEELDSIGGALEEIKRKDPNPGLCAKYLVAMEPVDVWHHLISRGPSELRSPHDRLGWSLSRYSRWMDNHTASEVWAEVNASLQEYAGRVDARGESHYDPVYAVLLEAGSVLLVHAESR